MTATYYDAKQVYSRNYGSERLYKRSYCNNLLYTEGVMDFQQTLDAFWVVDNVVSYMPKILDAYKKHEFTFFVVGSFCQSTTNNSFLFSIKVLYRFLAASLTFFSSSLVNESLHNKSKISSSSSDRSSLTCLDSSSFISFINEN